MGKKPDQIEQDIRTHREAISRRIEGLERRMQDDIQTIRSEAKDRASGAVDQAKDKIQNAPGGLRMENIKAVVEEHTVSSMAGALGVGVLLGVVSEGLGSGNGHGGGSRGFERNDARDRRDTGSNGGAIAGLSGILASVVGPAANTAQEELQDLVREGFSVMKQQVRQVKEDRDDSDVLVRNRDVGVE